MSTPGEGRFVRLRTRHSNAFLKRKIPKPGIKIPGFAPGYTGWIDTRGMVGPEGLRPFNKIKYIAGTETLPVSKQKQCLPSDSVSLSLSHGTTQRHVIDDASRWIAAQGSVLRRMSIPLVCNRFDLTILEAIEALKRSHAVTCGR